MLSYIYMKQSLFIIFVIFFGVFSTSHAEEVVYFSDNGNTFMPAPAVGRGVENPGTVRDYYATVFAFDVLQEQYRKETGSTPSNPLAFGNYTRTSRDDSETSSNTSQVIVQNIPDRDEEIVDYNDNSALASNEQGEIVRYGSSNVYTASVFNSSAGVVNSGTLFLFFLTLLIFIIVLRFTYKKRKIQKARITSYADPFHDQTRYHPRAW